MLINILEIIACSDNIWYSFTHYFYSLAVGN